MPAKQKVKKKLNFLSFQDIIMRLQKFWSKNGCVILQPYDLEVGAGTFHPATTLRSLGSKPWKAAYVQPSRRPTDGRYGENPNRLQHYYQYQVIIKPSPNNIKQIYLKSLAEIGIDVKNHDISLLKMIGKVLFRGGRFRLGSVVRWNGNYSIYLFSTNDWDRM